MRYPCLPLKSWLFLCSLFVYPSIVGRFDFWVWREFLFLPPSGLHVVLCCSFTWGGDGWSHWFCLILGWVVWDDWEVPLCLFNFIVLVICIVPFVGDILGVALIFWLEFYPFMCRLDLFVPVPCGMGAISRCFCISHVIELSSFHLTACFVC